MTNITYNRLINTWSHSIIINRTGQIFQNKPVVFANNLKHKTNADTQFLNFYMTPLTFFMKLYSTHIFCYSSVYFLYVNRKPVGIKTLLLMKLSLCTNSQWTTRWRDSITEETEVPLSPAPDAHTTLFQSGSWLTLLSLDSTCSRLDLLSPPVPDTRSWQRKFTPHLSGLWGNN